MKTTTYDADLWQLVPKEPTEEMLEYAHNADYEYTMRNFGDVGTILQQGAYDHYKAMLAAAPNPLENA